MKKLYHIYHEFFQVDIQVPSKLLCSAGSVSLIGAYPCRAVPHVPWQSYTCSRNLMLLEEREAEQLGMAKGLERSRQVKNKQEDGH